MRKAWGKKWPYEKSIKNKGPEKIWP